MSVAVQRARDTAESAEELFEILSLEIPSLRDREAFRCSVSAPNKKQGTS